MLFRPRTERPAILAGGLGDGQIVDRRDATPHQAALVELPVLVAVRSEPRARVVVPLVGEPDRDAVLAVVPELLDQPVVELARPLALEEPHDFLAPAEELRAVAPDAVGCV